ncbi:hypoxanthine phosphoribosyltransferase [Tepidibacillus infernus]|uniref:Hypoxanthine phosphoribosyltransferase n=1 Tax=Tepidibacillus decaturensis TaxID=1413211 RepID=A0A135L7H5_9BACI|nr:MULTISPECIES: hypoxanthine phosphoribosyltransferase [Tepidibacillus]KXG44857.1 hypoxanthine phosphoribosyltransferase [Tepidibacillus decaturensis]GBF11383.1 hypoxanthine-guanine phosphoribosyltransferase [Tepidibacillus sp. HK-1]
MENDIKEILITKEEIEQKVSELGSILSKEYEGKTPLMVCVLKGATLFMSDLVRHMNIHVEMDFMAVSSYGASTESSGVVRILKDLDTTIEGRDIIIVEDIIDSGLTLSYLVDLFNRRNINSIKIVTLLDKPHRRKVSLTPDLSGFVIPDEFVVGYGLDYNERYRNFPYIGVLKPEVYSR